MVTRTKDTPRGRPRARAGSAHRTAFFVAKAGEQRAAISSRQQAAGSRRQQAAGRQQQAAAGSRQQRSSRQQAGPHTRTGSSSAPKDRKEQDRPFDAIILRTTNCRIQEAIILHRLLTNSRIMVRYATTTSPLVLAGLLVSSGTAAFVHPSVSHSYGTSSCHCWVTSACPEHRFLFCEISLCFRFRLFYAGQHLFNSTFTFASMIHSITCVFLSIFSHACMIEAKLWPVHFCSTSLQGRW